MYKFLDIFFSLLILKNYQKFIICKIVQGIMIFQLFLRYNNFPRYRRRSERDDRYVRSNANLIQHRTDRGITIKPNYKCHVRPILYYNICTSSLVYERYTRNDRFDIINENFRLTGQNTGSTYWNFKNRNSIQSWSFFFVQKLARFLLLLLFFSRRKMKGKIAQAIIKFNKEGKNERINSPESNGERLPVIKI